MAKSKSSSGCLSIILTLPFNLAVLILKILFIFFTTCFNLFLLILNEMLSSLTSPKVNPNITGHDYEQIAANWLKKMGYSGVQVTKRSGDFGVDIIARKGNDRWAVQCKYYSTPVGVSAVQEVVGGKAHYGCNRAMVITNNTYTKPARRLAKENGVKLIEHISPRTANHSNELRNTIFIVSFILLAILCVSMIMSGTTNITFSDILTNKKLIICFIIISAFGFYLIRRKCHSKFKNTAIEKSKAQCNNLDTLQIRRAGVEERAQRIEVEKHESLVISSPSGDETNTKSNCYASINDNPEIPDPMLAPAIDIVVNAGYASTALIQMKLRVGYARAGRILDTMEQMGIIGSHEGSKSRRVLLTPEDNVIRKLSQ